MGGRGSGGSRSGGAKRTEIVTGAVETKRGITYRYRVYPDDSIELEKYGAARADGGYAMKSTPAKLTKEVKEQIKEKHGIDVWQF